MHLLFSTSACPPRSIDGIHIEGFPLLSTYNSFDHYSLQDSGGV